MDKYTVVQLRKLAKKEGFSGYSRMSKDLRKLLILRWHMKYLKMNNQNITKNDNMYLQNKN